MVFDPAAFENLEALKAQENTEADRAQIDAKIAAEWVDFDGAKNLMYWDLKSRTPEEVKEAKVAEAKENDLDSILAQLDWGDIFDTADETTIEWEDGLDNWADITSRSSSSEIRERINQRSWTEVNKTEAGNDNISVLDNTDERNYNTDVANKLFFSPENIQQQINLISVWDPKVKGLNTDWVEANLSEDWVIYDSFMKIQWNFVLPEWIEWNNLEEIFNSNPKRIDEVNDALSDAIELEVCTTTEWKVNYDMVAVEQLVKEMRSRDCPPLWKIKKFAEIYTKVQNSVAKWWKSQSEAFRKKQAQSAEAQWQERSFQEQKITELQKNNIQTRVSKEDQNSRKEEKPQNGGDIFTASDIDLSNSWSEITKVLA